MDENTMLAELEALKAENARLKSQATKGIRLGVSEKGGVSVFGLQRWPVTLYKDQMLTLLGMAEQIKAFIAEHDGALSTK